MGTVVVLAAFLLVASATPIELLSGGNTEDTPHSDHEGVNATDHDVDSTNNSQSLGEDYPANHDKEHGPLSDTLSVSNEDNTGNNGEGVSSSDSSVSTSSKEPPIMLPASNDSETNENTPNNKIELGPINGSENITEPPDADPSDCKNATVPGHIYLQCTYSCGGDEMLVAMNNTRCYLNETHKLTMDLPKSGVHINLEATETGVCINGDCVPAPTAPQTNISLTDAETSILPTDAPTNISLTGAETSVSPIDAQTSTSSDLLQPSTSMSEPGPVS